MTPQPVLNGRRSTMLNLLWPITGSAATVIVITTIATLFAKHHWLSDLLANLRVQQLIAGLAVLLLCIANRRLVWTAAVVVCLAIHMSWLLPVGSQLPAPQDKEHLTITVANVLTRNQRHDDIVADVVSRHPDVFVILELSSSLATTLDRTVGSVYPYTIIRAMDGGNFGIGLYSRHQIVESTVFTLNTEIESIDATISAHDKEYRIFATHPVPPMGSRGYRSRIDHLKQLAMLVRETEPDISEKRIIVVGDLNLTPWSPHFAAFEQASGLRRASDGFSITPTWYRYPLFPFGLVLDHALISSGLSCVDHVIGPDIGSDHRSVTVTLVSTSP